MNWISKPASLVVLLFAAGLFESNAQEIPVLKYEGSSTIAHFIEDASSVYPHVRFEIVTQSESSGGESAILDGTTDFGGVARTPSPRVLGKGVVSTLIGWDAIALVVHQDNPVHNLTTEQLHDIFTGKLTNWSQVGGPDLVITPFIVGPASATRNVFRSVIMGQDDYRSCTTIEPDYAILDRVRQTPGGIGQISFSFLGDSIADYNKIAVDGQQPSASNQSYPITRPLYLLWWPGRQLTADFAKWTSTPEAQALIMKRFIGKKQTTEEPKGNLLVYTATMAVEEGGAYFYPHEPYDIFTSDLKLLRTVKNHIDDTDEYPTPVSLKPGQYLIQPESSKLNGGKMHLATIEAGQSTIINIDESRAPNLTNRLSQGEQNLEFYGDFRFRVEQDWNSLRTNGTLRDDRGRVRYRLRLGFNYKLNEQITFGGRMRSGNNLNQQSPHITFGENIPENGIGIDKAFLQINARNWSWWLGKTNFPFWKQNEIWWDDDVTPEGTALRRKIALSSSMELNPVIGIFVMPGQNQTELLSSSMMAGQLALKARSRRMDLEMASGYYFFSNMLDREDTLQQSNRDYQLLISGVEARFKAKLPVSIGFDFMQNLADYNGITDTLLAELADEKTGFVASVKIGSLNDKGKWLFSYFYSHVERFSVVPYLAQDDWVRWDYGSIPGTRASNFYGHEIRLAYAIGRGFNVVIRGYQVEALRKPKSSDLSLESGNRFRIDFNLKF